MKPATEAEIRIARLFAEHPEEERPRESAFTYRNEDDRPCYFREARYAGRDADGEGRYGWEKPIEEVREEYKNHRQKDLPRRLPEDDAARGLTS